MNWLDPSGRYAIFPNPFRIIPETQKISHSVTIASGAPIWWQLCAQALTGNGGRLTYTDSDACWEWAIEENTFRSTMMSYASTFLTRIWSYARINFYDPNTHTFNLEGWDYEYPLSGTYRTPATPKYAKVHFSDEHGLRTSYFWIHNVVVVFDYTISFDEDQGGLTMTSDIKIIDKMDLHHETFFFDRVLEYIGGNLNYHVYPLRIYMGTHTIRYRHRPDSNGIRGITLDGEKWPYH